VSELIAALANPCETSTPNRLNPPPVRLPKLLQGLGFAVFRRKAMRNWIKRHGRIFEINVPFFGRSVVVSDPALVRSVCTASAEELSTVDDAIETGRRAKTSADSSNCRRLPTLDHRLGPVDVSFEAE
jgi:hypothetical protein